jgi:hypothetical protein
VVVKPTPFAERCIDFRGRDQRLAAQDAVLVGEHEAHGVQAALRDRRAHPLGGSCCSALRRPWRSTKDGGPSGVFSGASRRPRCADPRSGGPRAVAGSVDGAREAPAAPHHATIDAGAPDAVRPARSPLGDARRPRASTASHCVGRADAVDRRRPAQLRGRRGVEHMPAGVAALDRVDRTAAGDGSR